MRLRGSGEALGQSGTRVRYAAHCSVGVRQSLVAYLSVFFSIFFFYTVGRVGNELYRVILQRHVRVGREREVGGFLRSLLSDLTPSLPRPTLHCDQGAKGGGSRCPEEE